eukprot:13824164-Heterocapsa_arctica.AAC.1
MWHVLNKWTPNANRRGEDGLGYNRGAKARQSASRSIPPSGSAGASCHSGVGGLTPAKTLAGASRRQDRQ